MPYISNQRRAELEATLNFSEFLERFNRLGLVSSGDLNYILTKIFKETIKEVRYSDINNVIGVLECAKLELYRRIASPYEDKKIKENGDVYGRT